MTIRPVRRRPAEEDAFFVCGPVFLFIIVLFRLVRDEDNPTKRQVASQGHSPQWAQSPPSRPICRRTTRSSIVGSLRQSIRRRAHGVYYYSQLLSLVLFFVSSPWLASLTAFFYCYLNVSTKSSDQSIAHRERTNHEMRSLHLCKGKLRARIGELGTQMQRLSFRQVTIWQARNELLDSEFGRRPTLWSCLLAVFSCPSWP